MTFFDYAKDVESVQEFGIRDDEEGKETLKAFVLDKNPKDPIASIPAKDLPAFIDYNNKKQWNAIVLSENRNDFNFIPVDKNIEYFDEKGNEKSRCDAVIYTRQTVIFIELKDQMHDWFEDAVAHPVGEEPVVSDHEERAVAPCEISLEPFYHIEVEVVGGLVEDEQVGVGEQHVGQRHPFLLTSAELPHGLVEVAYLELGEHLFGPEHLLVVALMVEACVEHRLVGVEPWRLLEESHLEVPAEGDLSAVVALVPCDDAEQR